MLAHFCSHTGAGQIENVVLLQGLQGPPVFRLSRYKRTDQSHSFQAFTQPLRSVESVQQQEDGAHADHGAENERVPSLPQVDSLDQVVNGWETVWESEMLRAHCKCFSYVFFHPL